MNKKLSIIDRILGNSELSDDEIELYDIVSEMLKVDDTECKLNSTGKYYVFNKRLHYYIMFNESILKFRNSKSSSDEHMHQKWYQMLKEKTNNWLDSHIKDLDATIFRQKHVMLKEIKETLQKELQE